MSEKEDRVRLQGADGKEYLGNADWLKRFLGLGEVDRDLKSLQQFINNLLDRVRYIEGWIAEQEKPKRKQAIVQILREKGTLHTRQLMKALPTGTMWSDLRELVDEKVVEETISTGRSKLRIYRLAEASA